MGVGRVITQCVINGGASEGGGLGVRRVITQCVINARCFRRWLGEGKESDYTMCNQWWVLGTVVRWG